MDAHDLGTYIILHSMDPIIIQNFYRGKTDEEKISLTTGSELWKQAKTFCELTTGASAVAAFSEFTTFDYDDSLPVEKNLTKFETIIYTIQMSGMSIPDKLIQAQLLRSMSGDEWNSSKSSVAGNRQATFFDRKTRIIGEVIQRKIERTQISEVAALMASTSLGTSKGRGRGMGGNSRQTNKPTFRFGVLPQQQGRGQNRAESGDTSSETACRVTPRRTISGKNSTQ